MKNKILLSAMLIVACSISINVNAQLEVLTSGDVKMSKCVALNGLNVCDSVALKVKAPILTSTGNGGYGIYSIIKQSHPLVVTQGCGVGVLGRTLLYTQAYNLDGHDSPRPTSPFYAGVVGMSSTWVGIYGTTSSSLPSTWSEGNYAGYFNGNVKVTGLIYGQLATKLGDSRFLENITQLGSKNISDLLLRLNPVTFTLRQDSTLIDSSDDNITHYGLIAQEVQEIVPEIVHKDGAGFLSINYIELIPLLIQKVQELSAEVEELKNNSTIKK